MSMGAVVLDIYNLHPLASWSVVLIATIGIYIIIGVTSRSR